MPNVLIQDQVLKEGFKPITTQIFDKDSKYLDDDSVFAVKDSLVVEFVPREGDSQAKKELKYDLLVAPISAGGVGTQPAPAGIHVAE